MIKTKNSSYCISSVDSGQVWRFFYNIPDVSNLDGDSWAYGYQVETSDGEVIGMIVLNRKLKPKLVRVAVKENYRREGVGRMLVEQAMEDMDEVDAYVDEGNTASKELLRSLGFEESGWAPPPNLERWVYTSY